MRIETSVQRFEKSWEPTGEMIKESETTFVQTYRNKGFGKERFKQVGRGELLGTKTVILESVKS